MSIFITVVSAPSSTLTSWKPKVILGPYLGTSIAVQVAPAKRGRLDKKKRVKQRQQKNPKAKNY